MRLGKQVFGFLFLMGPFSSVFSAEVPSSTTPLYYDEYRDDSGAVRPQYAPLADILDRFTDREKNRASRLIKRDFRGDYALDLMPRILTQDEHSRLQTGIMQRARLMQQLMIDHYSGKKTYLKVVPKRTVNRAFGRSQDNRLEGSLPPEAISFLYAPDIVRTPEGRFAAMEDNPGDIGGLGDGVTAHWSLLKRIPGYRARLPTLHDPQDFYKGMMAFFRRHARPADGKIVLYNIGSWRDSNDLEVYRYQENFRNEGVEIVNSDSKSQKVVADQNGVFLERHHPGGKLTREPVGYLIAGLFSTENDWSHPAFRSRVLAKDTVEELALRKVKLESADRDWLRRTEALGPEALGKAETVLTRLLGDDSFQVREKDNIPGFINAVLKGQVGTNIIPGSDWLGDKELYPYMDKLFAHYFPGEEFQLRNIPSESFSNPKTRAALFAKIEASPQQYVVKLADSYGGKGVWVGALTPRDEFDNLIRKVRRNPSAYVAQDFTHLSVINGNVMDLRGLTTIRADDIYVSPHYFSRFVPLGANRGLVNTSSGGGTAAVFVLPHLPCDFTQLQ